MTFSDKDKGLLYTIPETRDQLRSMFEGFVVGFYHDPEVGIDSKCLDSSIEGDLEFVLNMIFGHENLFHFIEAVRFTQKASSILQSMFDNCGYKKIMQDMRSFCKAKKQRCEL